MTTLSAPARATRALLLALAALLLGVFLAVASPAQPAAASCGGTTTVGNEAELNAAIAAFNAETTTPCVFTIQLSGNIALTASTQVIGNATSGVSLVINGGGFAVNGQGIAGVQPFEIGIATVMMNDLTIAGGRATGPAGTQSAVGGGIFNAGNLTLNNSVVTGNTALEQGGGIFNTVTTTPPGNLTLNNSVVRQNAAVVQGGGIFNSTGATATVNNSTISGNTTTTGSGQGGSGVANRGAMTIANSTISGNTGGTFGGGVANIAGVMTIDNSTISGNEAQTNGGGIDNAGAASLTIRNSTISGNTSGFAGGIVNRGTLTLDSVTIAGNTFTASPGGGALLQILGTTTIANSILVNSAGGPDCYYDAGTVVDGGHNLVESQAAASNDCGFVNGANGNIVGSDPQLIPLANNGGSTQTHALLAGSPAIDAGDTTLTTDQRGEPRPSGAADDIGAYEVQVGAITIVKVTIPANAVSFGFTDNIEAPNSFSLSNGQQKTFANVVPGPYAVSEDPQGGAFQLRLIACTDGDPAGTPSTGNVPARTATINVDPGETVTCTFTNSNQPLGVTLGSFDAQAQAGHVSVTWETVSELQNSGFNLYRTVTADPPTAANLLMFVPSQGPGSAQGFFYSHQDYDVTAGQTYWYWLEDVDFAGIATLHGSVSVTYSAPTAVTLSGFETATDQPVVLAWPWLLAVIAAALALAVGNHRRSRA